MKYVNLKKIMKGLAYFFIGILGLLVIKYFVIDKTAIKKQEGALIQMLGVEDHDPKQSSTYQSVSGMVALQYWKTSKGVPVYFVEVANIPMVDVEILFDAGAARNGAKGGLAYLANQMITEGTTALSADQVAENFENVGAQYQASSQRDMATFTLRSLSDPTLFAPALDTLTAILSSASFPDAGFQRIKQNMLTALKKQAQNPSQVASKAFYQAIYPQEPYSNWILGDEASVSALTLEEVKSFYKQFYVANNAAIAIVGNVSPTEANAIAEKLTNALPAGQKPQPLPEVKNLSASSIKRIDFPSSQTHILMGEPLIKQGDPDYYALYTGNHILGGNGSVTRIFNTIRGQHGLAYSAYSYFQPMRERGPYVLGCQTRNEEADKALQLLQQVLKEFVQTGPTQKELDDAKLNLLGGYALDFDSNEHILQQIAQLAFYQLPLNYFNEFKTAVEKLTIQDIQKAFQNRVTPDSMAVIMVGQSATRVETKK